jgi:[acyl-carrier-protein] S-malonyltransferase
MLTEDLSFDAPMNIAFLCPGQGSHAVGMLSKFADPATGDANAAALIDQTYREASAILGWDVGALVREGPAEELNRTERTQPALLTASIALWRVWLSHQAQRPGVIAGHSLGEYSALVIAGAMDFADALRLVEIRGRLMQNAVPEGTGGMAAVLGLDDDKVEALCAEYAGSGTLEPINYNAPGQIVVAGTTEALDWLQANGKDKGAKKIVRLSVSVPSHCSLMKDAARQLAVQLEQVPLRMPTIPVLHNLDARARQTLKGIREALIEQLHRPVRWTQTIRAIEKQGVGAFVECGPGKVLGTMNKRILGDNNAIPSVATEDPQALQTALQTVAGTALLA